MTQRDLGDKLDKPQSWIHNCEVGNRRVDVAEFVAWARACGVEPATALERFIEALAAVPKATTTRKKRRRKSK